MSVVLVRCFIIALDGTFFLTCFVSVFLTVLELAGVRIAIEVVPGPLTRSQLTSALVLGAAASSTHTICCYIVPVHHL